MKTRSLLTLLIAAIMMNGNLAWPQTQLFRDEFNAAPLDETVKWRRGDATTVAFNNGLLQVSPPVNKAGWIVTQDAFSLDNTTIKIKILQANKDGNIGICPSYPKSKNDLGIYSEASWYRFYVGRDPGDPDTVPYRLYAHKKKQRGDAERLATTQLPTSSGSVDLRLRFDGAQTPNAKIYFEYSTNGGANWTLLYQQAFDLPGYSLNNAFHGEIATTNSLPNTGTLQVDEFEVTSNSATPMIGRIILDDPLNSPTFDNRKDESDIDPGFKVQRWNEGSNLDFAAAGWKPNPASPAGDGDLVHYDLRRYIEKGMLEVDVTQFQPEFQNSMPRHHVLAMFRMPWGGHHVVENLDAMWDFHTGKLDIMLPQSGEPLPDQFSGGVKLYSHTYAYQDENQTYVTNGTSPWNKTQSYHLTIFWEANQIKYLKDGEEFAMHPIINAFNNEMQLRYAYVGRDRTVCSGDFVIDFMKNQYKTMRDADGPIYSNLVIKELVSAVDVTPPTINHIIPIDEYANGARIYFYAGGSDRNVAYYVEYGTTSTNLDSRTQVLGPNFDINYEASALLTNLSPNTTYYYRVVGQDVAGNVGKSSIRPFTTLQEGLYIFQPVADTYIEDNNTNAPWLYGDTRAYGNYGWMNLMTSERRDCFLQFNVSAVTRPIVKATLRLHGRQSGQTGGELKQFTPVSGNTNTLWENNATWVDATSSNPQYVNRNEYKDAPPLVSFTSITADQWRVLDVSAATRDANNNYYFVLQGTGTPPNKISCGAFDSKESTNFQPELIVETTPLFSSLGYPGSVKNGAAAWGDYDGDGDGDLDLLITGDTGNGIISKVYRNDGGNFVDISAALTPVTNGAVAWGDYDLDNDLDILLTGSSTSGRIAKVYRNDNGNFVAHSFQFEPIDNGSVAWGDYNNNGFLDILLSGQASGGPFTRIYRGLFNGTGKTWVAMDNIILPQLTNSSAAWGDNNLDGYFDILLAGTDPVNNAQLTIFENEKNQVSGARDFEGIAMTGVNVVPTNSCAWLNFDGDRDPDIAYVGVNNPNTGVYKRKTDGTFQLMDDATLVDLKDGTASWGDYDNDGDLDLLVTGVDNAANYYCRLYKYNPAIPKFFFAYDFEGVRYSSTAWGDYDNDGDLDLFVAGENKFGTIIGRLYRNNSLMSNNLPSVPVPKNPSSVYSDPNKTFTLSWNRSTDDTPNDENILTYNVMIGTSSGGFDIVSPMSTISTGKRLIPAPGNAGTNDFYIVSTKPGVGLAPGTYYWKVQAIDNVFGASAFSTEASFVVPTSKATGTDSLADRDSSAIAQAIPQTFALSQNYPNPFNPTTRLNLNLPENGRVKAVVYDLTGQEVARLQEAEIAAGYKYLTWDGKNNHGTAAGSGAYLVKVIFEGISGMRKESSSRILLLK